MELAPMRLKNRIYLVGKRAVRSSVAFMTSHPVLSSFLVALGVRVVVAISTGLLHKGTLIGDEGQYLILALMASEGKLTSEFWAGYGQSLFETTRTFMWPLTTLFWLFGPSRIVAQLLVATFGAVTSACAACLASRFLRREYALGAGLIVALFPSQVLWSSVVLRESLIWAGLAAIAVTVDYSQRSESGLRTALLTVLLGLLFVATVWLREHSALLALWCLCPALLVGRSRLRIRILAASCLLIFAPWVVGLGPGGSDYARDAMGSMGNSRAYMAMSANSSFGVNQSQSTSNSTDSSISEGLYDCSALLEGQSRGSDEIGEVASRLIDRPRGEWICIHDQFGIGRLVDNRLITSFQRIPGGLYDTMIRPLPREGGTDSTLALAGWESLLWIALYGLAAYGLLAHGKGHRVLVYPTLLLFSLSISGAVTHGNLGTAFRHRGQVCFVLAVMAMAGVQAIVERRRVGRRERSLGPVSDHDFVDRDER
jgi:hypothetical protein